MSSSKPLIWIGMTIGSTVGGYIPTLWGDSFFSLWSVLFTAIGGVAGILIGFKLSND